MQLESWLDLSVSVLRPSRPRLDQCLREAEAHVAERHAAAERRAQAMRDCERRIEAARAVVFAANDGVVSARMTELEREWRQLARRDADDNLMDLWARMAPARWIDRKIWRDEAEGERLQLASALAADPEGVTTAENAVTRLRAALATWGVVVGSEIHWRAPGERIMNARKLVESLLAPTLAACVDALMASDACDVVVPRATRLETAVAEAAAWRLPDGAAPLAGGLAHAAFVDFLWCAVNELRLPLRAPTGATNPVALLRELWSTGYALGECDHQGVTLIAPLTGIALGSARPS